MGKGKDEIWAIVLAAGESSRMKSPKMVLPFGSKTIIETVVDNVTLPAIAGIIVVTGGWKDEVMKVLEKYSVLFCYNHGYKAGMFSSVLKGIESLPASATAFMIMPGDQPMIGKKTIEEVVSASCRSGKGISLPVSDGRRGHPVVVVRKYRDELLSMQHGNTFRDFISSHNDDICEVPADNSVLRDIDTHADYIEELKLMN